jgi:coenzyme F420 hydrogenase subunit beta
MLKDVVIKNDLCTGCGLCESVFGKEKIKIKFNNEGFLRPSGTFKLNSDEEDLFEKICPGINSKHHQPIKDKGYDSFLGPYISIHSGYATDAQQRFSGSSGGGLTALASYLLDTSKADCVLHMGFNESKPYLNEFKVSRTASEVLSNSGSRYAPSATLVDLVGIVKKYHKIAIIGKPCDIVAVRNYMKTNELAKSNIKYLLSFMCAGVPSQKGTQKLIEGFNLKEENISELRYRGDGWPGYFKVKDKQGKFQKMTYNDSWGNVLNRYLQFRCKICPDGTGEFADITFADAWAPSKSGYPSFEEKDGKSLIIPRTGLGEKLLNDAVLEGYLGIHAEHSLKEVALMQPYQKQRKQNMIVRYLALKILGRNTPNYNRKLLLANAFRENPITLLKNFLGMVKRII